MAPNQSPDKPLPTTDEVVAKTATVVRQLDRMIQMIDTLRDMSQVTAGKLELYREQLDLGALVR